MASVPDQWAEPTWPLKEGDQPEWNQNRLRRARIAPWPALEQRVRPAMGKAVGSSLRVTAQFDQTKKSGINSTPGVTE